MDELQRLSLISKVLSELDRHLGAGIADNTLVEFIIDLAEKNPTPKAFWNAVSESGAEFPQTFTDNLLSIIQRMAPKKRKADAMSGGGSSSAATNSSTVLSSSSTTTTTADKAALAAQFPGLAVPNTAPVDIVGDDDFLGLGADAEDDVEFLASRSSRRRDDERSSSSSSAAASSAPDIYSYNPRARVDDAPVLYKIYRGRVSKLMDFGAFVTLEGIATQVEGLVHKDALCASGGRADPGGAASVSQLVKVRDVVYVKVLGATKTKVSLSMIEADQATGKDRNPGRAQRAAAMARGQDVNITIKDGLCVFNFENFNLGTIKSKSFCNETRLGKRTRHLCATGRDDRSSQRSSSKGNIFLHMIFF